MAKLDPLGSGFFVGSLHMWFVYICQRREKLYTGIATQLEHRMAQHNTQLLYYEEHPDKFSAARREKQIKGWRKDKKLALGKSPENPVIPSPANSSDPHNPRR